MDCSGTAEATTDIKTTGECFSVKDPRGVGPNLYMIASQESDVLKSMKKPVMAVYEDLKCSTIPSMYIERGKCQSYGDNSFQEICISGEPQTCTWFNATGCPDTSSGRNCRPSPFSSTCRSFPQPTGRTAGYEEVC